MKSILFCLALLTTLPLFAQEESYNPYFDFVVGEEYYLLADKVNVRNQAGTKAELTTSLPIGTKIKVVANSKEKYTIKGLEAPWIKVSFEENKKLSTGYIWAGFIARTAVASTVDPSMMYLAGTSSIEKYREAGLTQIRIKSQVRLCKNNQEITRIEVPTIGSLATGMHLESLGAKGVSNLKDIVHFSFSDGYCGGAGGMQVLFWTGTELKHVSQLSHGFDAPVFAHQFFVYPADEGGKKNLIILKDEVGEYNDNGVPKYDQQSSLEYIWKDGSLSPVKKK